MPEDYSAFTPVEQPESTQDTTQFTPVDPVVDTTQFTPVEANKTEPQENVDLRDYGRGSTNSHPWEDWGMSLDEWNKLPQTERTAKTFGWWMNKPVSGAVTNESMGNIESTLMSPIAAIPRIPEPSQSTIDAWGQAATELGMPHLAGAARIIPQAATAATNQIAIPLANFAQSPAMPLTILTGGAGAIGRAAVTGTFLGQTLKQGIEQFPQHVQDLTNTSLSDQQRLNALGGIVNETVLPPLILHGGMHGQPPVTEGEAALANANAMTKALQGEQLSGFTDPITGEPITKAKAIELGLSKEIPTSPEYAWTTLRPQRGMPDQQAVAEPLTLAEPAPVPEQVEVPEPMAVPESPVVPEPPTVPEPREVGQPTSSTQQEQAPPTRLADFNRAIGRVSSMIPSAAPLYVPAPQTPITNQINSAKAGFEGVTQLNKMASDVALGKPAEEPAQPPATYAGHMDGFGNLPGFDLYNLNVDLPGHPKNSTVSEHTLRDNNIDPSQILKTSTQESNAIRQQEPTEMDVLQQAEDGPRVGGQNTLVQEPPGARQPGEQQDLAGAEAQGGAGAQRSEALTHSPDDINRMLVEGQFNKPSGPVGAPALTDPSAPMVRAVEADVRRSFPSAGESWVSSMAQAVQTRSADISRIVRMMGDKLYSAETSKTTGKELIQNAIDAVHKIPDGRMIGIGSKFKDGKSLFAMSDNGQGMTPYVILDKLLPAGVSGKAIGEGGGFGLGKIAIFGGNKSWKLVSIAKIPSGYMRSILTGTGPSYYDYIANPPRVRIEPNTDIRISDGMNLRYDLIPGDTPGVETGTAIEIHTTEGNTSAGFARAALQFQPSVSGIRLNLLLDYESFGNNKITPLDSIGWSKTSDGPDPPAPELRLMQSIKTPIGTIDFLVPENTTMKKGSFFYVPILNRGILQFEHNLNTGTDVALPKGLAVNIKPSVAADSADYPFTTNREYLIAGVKGPINEWARQAGLREAEAQNARYKDAIKYASPISGQHGLVFLDAGGAVPKDLIKEISSNPIVSQISGDIAKMQNAILDILKRRYPEEASLGRASFGGLMTAGKAYGVHFGRPYSNDASVIYHDPFLTWRDAFSDAEKYIDRNGGLNPAISLDDMSAQQYISRVAYEFWRAKTAGIALHEALHQITSSEGEELARHLTFKAGDLLDPLLAFTHEIYEPEQYRKINETLSGFGHRLAEHTNPEEAGNLIISQGGYNGYALEDRSPGAGGAGEAGVSGQGAAPIGGPARGLISNSTAFKNAQAHIEASIKEGRVNMNMSPSDFWSYMVYGAGKMEEGLINSAEWIAHMAAIVPAELKPHLQGMYQYAKEIMENATRPTSGKNAQTDLDRMERGLPPAHLAISRAFEESSKLAEKKEADNPGYTDKLTAELLNHPRAAQDYETAALLHKKVELENMQDKAMKEALKPGLSGDELGRAINDAADLHNALLDNYTALRESGTELGRGMNIRKMLENEDYSLEHMQVKKEAAGVGLKLTDEQKAARKVATSKIFDRITQGNEAIEKHAADLDEKKSQKAADDSIANIKVDLAAEAIPPKIRQLANRIIAKIDAEADTARVELSKYFGSAHAMIAPDPAVVVNLAKVMASHVAHGLDKVASSSQLLATYGKGVLAFIDRAWEVANRLVDSNAPENKTAFRHAIKAVRVSAEKKADIVAAMKDGFEKGRKVQEMGRYANILERMVVESGVEGREEVTDAVHKILVEEVDPTITRREARDAMSHYGQYQKLDKDAIKAKIRQNHGEMQNLSKMEDLEAGQNPSKTGKQRPEKGDDWRHLEAQVNEAKRRSGLRSDDPETQLKSALDTIETRLKNQISDLNYQIVNRAKIVKDRTKVVEDEETTRLRAQVAELKTQFNAIFNTPEMTDANRLKAAERIADRQITELERQIRMREPFEPGRKAPVTSEALEAKKARIEALKHERQMIRDQLQPPPEAKSPEEREIELKERQLANLEEAVRTETVFSKGKKPRTEIQSTRLDQLNANIKATKERIAAMREALQPREYKTRDEIGNQIYRARAAHQLADYRDKLARGDFSPRQKPAPIELDKESLALQAEVLRAKNDYNRGLLADRMANRDTWEKIADVVPRFRRAAILSSLGILKKLSSAAVLRMGLTPMEEIARSGLRHLPIIRGVAEKAPRYGRGFMWDAEKAALMDPVNHGLRDMWDIIRTGQTSRDVLYGKGHDLATGEYPILHSVLEFPGRTHGVLKATVKGSEEARAEVQRFAHEDRQGKNMADLTDKEKFAIRQKAYNNGLAAIFLQDNILASGVNRLAGHFQSVNPITGRTRVAGKLFSVATRTMLPIVKVPSNVVAETMEWALGSVFGSLDIAYDTKLKMGGWGNLTKAMMKADTAKIGAALKDAISSMSDDEADMVMRMLGRGLLGPAILAVGCMYYKNIGGYYEQHEKRFPGEIQPEKFKIGKVTLSGRVVHHPVTGLLDFAATIMRLKDRMVPYEGKMGFASAFGSAAWDMLFQTPIFREMLEMDKLNDPATRGDFLGDLEKSFVVPRGIQELAEWRDQNSSGDTIRRKTKGFLEPIQSGIPIWRNQLPQKPPAGSSKSTGFKTPRIPKH